MFCSVVWNMILSLFCPHCLTLTQSQTLSLSNIPSIATIKTVWTGRDLNTWCDFFPFLFVFSGFFLWPFSLSPSLYLSVYFALSLSLSFEHFNIEFIVCFFRNSICNLFLLLPLPPWNYCLQHLFGYANQFQIESKCIWRRFKWTKKRGKRSIFITFMELFASKNSNISLSLSLVWIQSTTD